MASKWREIQIICKDCEGTGKKIQGVPPGDEPCLDCNETGYKTWGRIKFKKDDFSGDD